MPEYVVTMHAPFVFRVRVKLKADSLDEAEKNARKMVGDPTSDRARWYEGNFDYPVEADLLVVSSHLVRPKEK